MHPCTCIYCLRLHPVLKSFTRDILPPHALSVLHAPFDPSLYYVFFSSAPRTTLSILDMSRVSVNLQKQKSISFSRALMAAVSD